MTDTKRSIQLSTISQEFKDPSVELEFQKSHWRERSQQNLTTCFCWLLVVGLMLFNHGIDLWADSSTLFYSFQLLGYLVIRWLSKRPDYYRSYDALLALTLTAMIMSGVSFHLLQPDNSMAMALFIMVPPVICVAMNLRFYYTLLVVGIVMMSFSWALHEAELFDDFNQLISFQIFVSAGIGLVIHRLITTSRRHDYARLITEQRYSRELTEARLASEKANQHKSLFLAQASHDIRTPMTGVLGLTRLLQKTDLSPKQLSLLEAIEASSNSLTNLMNQLLDLSRIEQGMFKLEEKVFTPRQTIEEVSRLLRPLAEEKGLIITNTFISPNDFTVHGDEGRLRQILINLISNAIQYTENGTIGIHLSMESSNLVIEVADSGTGIPVHEQEEIFNSFYQAGTIRNSYGLGLGLSISRELAKALKGDLTYHNSRRSGSTFRLELPVTVLHESRKQKQPTRSADQPLCGYLLIVEDNRINSLVVKETILSIEPSLKVDTAFDGEQAVKLCRKNHYNLILMDCVLPKMNGFAALREIRDLKLHRNTPVAAVTASAAPEDERRCHDAGFNYFITKPIKESELLHILNLHLADNHTHSSSPHTYRCWNPDKCLRQMAGKTSTMVKAIGMALEDLPSQLEQINNPKLSVEHRRKHAHQMKGTLKTLHATVGLSGLEALQYEADFAAPSAQKHLSRIHTEMNDFQHELRSWLARQ